MTIRDYNAQPVFNWKPEVYVSKVWKKILILALWTAFLFAMGYKAFRNKIQSRTHNRKYETMVQSSNGKVCWIS